MRYRHVHGSLHRLKAHRGRTERTRVIRETSVLADDKAFTPDDAKKRRQRHGEEVTAMMVNVGTMSAEIWRVAALSTRNAPRFP